ncbi:MAG: tRNA pseudouridine(55) synthase TruB, partial [Deltaproteobacteria bacterium]
MDGILLVDKKKGDTSTETLNKVKRILRPKKIGHAGTLDPFA